MAGKRFKTRNDKKEKEKKDEMDNYDYLKFKMDPDEDYKLIDRDNDNHNDLKLKDKDNANEKDYKLENNENMDSVINRKEEKLNQVEFEEKLKKIQEKHSTKQKELKKKTSAKKIIFRILIIIILVFLLALLVAYFFVNGKLSKLNHKDLDANQLGIDTSVQDEMKDYRNIAILGVDSRSDTYSSDYRTDSIMVASINKKTGDIQLFSIYRDTYVQMELNGKTYYDKINHAYYNGPENTIKTINKNLDLNIDDFALADFNAVRDLVNAVGGIDLDITREELKYINNYILDVNKVTGSKSKNITSAGTQHVDGTQAVAYCRIRYTTGWDFKRTERMRTVLQKTVNKIKNLSLTQLNSLLNEMLPKIETSLSKTEIYTLVPQLLKMNISKSFGWPYQTVGTEFDNAKYGPSDGVKAGKDYYGVPKTLESNVVKLHQEVYGQTNYVVSENVKTISEKIKMITGVK